jgi:hypothetical protein
MKECVCVLEREKDRERERESVCVCEREREREREIKCVRKIKSVCERKCARVLDWVRLCVLERENT